LLLLEGIIFMNHHFVRRRTSVSNSVVVVAVAGFDDAVVAAVVVDAVARVAELLSLASCEFPLDHPELTRMSGSC
jgi:hypothetical protein